MLAEIKQQAGISSKLASCHTAKIDGYVIEVPAPDIKRLVAEHPDVVGLTVPGMPVALRGTGISAWPETSRPWLRARRSGLR